MKQNNNFEKFLPKKKNSVIKEEFRQEKRKFKKERAEQIELKKRAQRQSPTPAGKGRAGDAASATPSKPVLVLKPTEQMPLNKFIAHCGVCSRRDAAILVRDGKIKVNGEVVTEPGFKLTDKDEVRHNGKVLFPARNLVYILLNKPKDYITTSEDTHGRKTVLELLKGATTERIYPIGRLDRNTTGVLLLTNDGELTQKLSHPSFEVRKTYEVKLDKPLTKAHFDKIAAGITLEDGPVRVDALAFADPKDKSVIGIEIHSGRNRIVRRIFESLGYDVRNLDRVMFANLTKKNVDRGKWRFLKEKEVRLLKFMNSSFLRKAKDAAADDLPAERKKR
jgi:23S rRNA pseudouridine2605 synthase